MIEWIERRVAVSDLKPYEKNPRLISDEQYAALVKSIRENGYHQRILATRDLRVIGGHQRIKALNELGIVKVAVLVPDSEIPDEQFRRLLIQDNLPFGEWDKAMLAADFKREDLESWGFEVDWGIPKQKNINFVVGDNRFLLLVELKDEPSLAKLYERLQAEGFSCKIMN